MNLIDRLSLSGKNVIITGGGGILGQHFCSGLLQAGAKVAIFDVRKNEEWIASLSNQDKSNVRFFQCDVTSRNEVKEAVQSVVDEWRHIDVLHNNAAGKSHDLEQFFAPFESYSPETWNEIMSVNLNGAVIMAQVVGAHMLANNIRGSIVQTCSIYGVMAPDQRIYEGSEYMGVSINTPAVYSASKAALHGLTKYLAAYWASKGIRVNSITPGGVESGQNQTFVNRYSNRVPMGRMARPEEMVGALLFLASDASSYITGQNIVIDGGLSAW